MKLPTLEEYKAAVQADRILMEAHSAVTLRFHKRRRQLRGAMLYLSQLWITEFGHECPITIGEYFKLTLELQKHYAPFIPEL